jgi:hypothetical protein
MEPKKTGQEPGDPTAFEIHDDYVEWPYASPPQRVPRPDGVPKKQFRIMWQFIKNRHVKRGPMEEVFRQQAEQAMGPRRAFLRMAGYSDEEIAEMTRIQ